MSAIFGELMTFAQRESKRLVQLRVFGDEFYWRYETPDGYAAVYDHKLGLFCFATLAAGRLVSSGAPVTKRPPPGIKRHLREQTRIRRDKERAKRAQLTRERRAAALVHRNLPAEAALLPGLRLSEGEVCGLTILVDFPWLDTRTTQDDVFRLLNGHRPDEEPPAGPPSAGQPWSVYQYFRLVSGGKLHFTNDVVGPIRMDQKQGYYIDHLIVEEAVTKALEQYDLDLSDYDSLGRGVVDSLTIMYAGRTVHAENLWPHNSIEELTFGDMKTKAYAICSMGREPVDLTVGTFCHEAGHMICRFPDLYDYGDQDGDHVDSWGLGVYCLMSYGNHQDAGRTPAPPCAYLRDLVGWCQPTSINVPGTYTAVHGRYDQVFKFSTERPNEYFLVENRCAVGLDSDLDGSGLAVYHCDTEGSNEWQAGESRRHYQCALLQADGRQDLERSVNAGDEDDLFGPVDGIALAHDTNPSTREWDGTDSGLVISHIGPAGVRIPFTVGGALTHHKAHGASRPDLLIPDQDPRGVRDEIRLDDPGQVASLTVSVDVTHPWRGDLRLQLRSPAGARVELFRGRGGPGADFVRTFAPADCPALADLVGESIPGAWSLQVADRYAEHQGRLNRWALDIDAAADGRWLEGEQACDLAIPDDDASGVEGRIKINRPGVVRSVQVGVDIRHPYVGDLLVELIAPDGRSAVLHDRAGEAQRNLERTFASTDSEGLALLAGAAARGTWRLRVRDLAPGDKGRLRSWRLKLECRTTG